MTSAIKFLSTDGKFAASMLAPDHVAMTFQTAFVNRTSIASV
jgi:hypothetical protein